MSACYLCGASTIEPALASGVPVCSQCRRHHEVARVYVDQKPVVLPDVSWSNAMLSGVRLPGSLWDSYPASSVEVLRNMRDAAEMMHAQTGAKPQPSMAEMYARAAGLVPTALERFAQEADKAEDAARMRIYESMFAKLDSEFRGTKINNGTTRQSIVDRAIAIMLESLPPYDVPPVHVTQHGTRFDIRLGDDDDVLRDTAESCDDPDCEADASDDHEVWVMPIAEPKL
jgi:hypothetical protein